jgi:uncharacterized protein (TIGR03086 family)
VDVADLHKRAIEGFGKHMHAVGDDQWSLPTPCSEWDVRTLCNHLIYESLWTAPLINGQTIEEVGDQFEGDVLGDDPKAAWDRSARTAVEAVGQPGAMERKVHLSSGDAPAREYVLQLFADYLVHSWDLARAIGGDEKLDPELVDACAQWFESMEEQYRSGGVVAERPRIIDNADPQTRLLAMFGRTR